ERAVLPVGLEAQDTLAACRANGIREGANVRADIQDDVGGDETWWQLILVQRHHAVEDHSIERAGAKPPPVHTRTPRRLRPVQRARALCGSHAHGLWTRGEHVVVAECIGWHAT